MSLQVSTNYVVRFLFNSRTEGGTHIKTKDWSLKSSQSCPCWVAEALPLRRCVSDVLWSIPTEKSWETLSDPVIQAGDSWALGRGSCLLSSGVDSVKEGESLLFMSLGFHLICHNTTPSVLAQQDACLQSMCQGMVHNQGRKTRVLNRGVQGRCISRESIDRGDHWISLVWPDWIFTNDIKLSWVTGGLSDWVATGSGFLFFLGL